MLDFESNMYPCLIIIVVIPDGNNEWFVGTVSR